jgi:Ferritin-like domain
MSDDLHTLDCDGALAEAMAATAPTTRRAALRALAAAGLVGSAAILVGTGTGTAEAADNEPQGDIAILNFALTLEYLQSSFYTETQRINAVTGEAARLVRIVGGHERAHVHALAQLLGSRAVPKPKFDFRGATESQNAFVRTAVAFEDLGVAAYKGQAPRISSVPYLNAALAIHAVEARHAAWIRRVAGVLPARSAFDQPATASQVLSVVDSTHFIVGSTQANGMPGFTG